MFRYGLIAQLVERRVRNAEARGSNPLKSTNGWHSLIVAHRSSSRALYFKFNKAENTKNWHKAGNDYSVLVLCFCLRNISYRFIYQTTGVLFN